MIETEGLTKQFGVFTAVDGIHLAVREGEVLALLGPNGAGKTTTVRMLASILKPTAGWARVAGHDTVRDAKVVRQLVGLLTEFPGLRQTVKMWCDGSLERGAPAEFLPGLIGHSAGMHNHIFHLDCTTLISATAGRHHRASP